MIQMILKEIKLQLRSISFYVFLGIIIIFYVTLFRPPKYNTVLAPLDDMHFMYKTLIGDYYTGKVINRQALEEYKIDENASNSILTESQRRIKSLADIKLSDAQKVYLKNTIQEINPIGLNKNFNIPSAKFKISSKDFSLLLTKIDNYLGGMTYYGDKYRQSYIDFTNYNAETFEPKRMDKLEEMNFIYNHMKEDLLYGSIQKHKNDEEQLGYSLTLKQ